MEYPANACVTRPQTGEEYLESLRDGREVWFAGKRVDDVTTHPAFRNSAANYARLYDSLHDPAMRDKITVPTDTGSGGYTHAFFRVARNSEDLVKARDACVEWARMTYGWMGRSPDYKACMVYTLGANDEFYADNLEKARAWYKKAQEDVLFFNHAIVNPPIDRAGGPDSAKDVMVHVTKETDAGIYVTGAKVVATASALTQYNFIGQYGAIPSNDPDMALLFISRTGGEGVKLISRQSYEYQARQAGHPFDYPLSSRFDENDAILIFDNAFIPWENVLLYKDIKRSHMFFPGSGMATTFALQALARMAVKLDFLAGLLIKCTEMTGSTEFRGVQVNIGEVIGLRHLIWALSDAMVHNPVPWHNGTVLPNPHAASAARAFASHIYVRVKDIIQQVVASGLIYLPASVNDLRHPEVGPLLAKYCRGSNGIDYVERIKTLKLMWDAIGTEFGGRHELYELNYAGNTENTKLEQFFAARGSGLEAKLKGFVEQCMSEYDENGWRIGRLS